MARFTKKTATGPDLSACAPLPPSPPPRVVYAFSSGFDSLEGTVNSYLARGYQLQGPLVVDPATSGKPALYIQTLIRK